ncbi:hypothetical protein ACLB2K_038737 [Fragaria x ananassa]
MLPQKHPIYQKASTKPSRFTHEPYHEQKVHPQSIKPHHEKKEQSLISKYLYFYRILLQKDQLEEAQNKYHDSLGKRFLEILEAQFQVAYKSGNNVSKLLKTEDVGAQSCGEGTFSKLCRSLTTSLSVRVGSACNVELGDKLPRKQHSSTLKELCEWETKLYNEVKKLDKDGGEVTKNCAVDNFKEIQKLRDGELQQQIGELLKALWRDWKVMSECHSIQKDIISKAETYDVLKVNNASTDKKIKELKQDLSNWRRCFAAYISSQKAYVRALDSWVSHSFPSFCEDDNIHENHNLSLLLNTWSSAGLEELPVKEVTDAMKSLEKQVEELKVQLRKEGKQKRKVKRLKRRVQELKIKVIKFDDEGDDEKLGSLEYKLSEEEKALHSRIEKREVAANAVCTGFSSVFESLAEFSETCYEKIAEVIDKREHVHCGGAKRRLKSITALHWLSNFHVIYMPNDVSKYVHTKI